MKFIFFTFLLIPVLAPSQNISNSLDIEAGGSSILYSLGLSTHFRQKDSSTLGFRIGLGYYPIGWNSSEPAYSFVPSLQFHYNPSRFLNGKLHFSGGTTFYINDATSTSGSDPNNGISWITYSPKSTSTSFNTSVYYNILKKTSKLSLDFGVNLIIAYRDIRENHVDLPVIPWPSIKYGVKF